MPNVSSVVLGGIAGSLLSALIVLLIIDWCTGLHNAALSVALAFGSIVSGLLAASRLSGARAARSVARRVSR